MMCLVSFVVIITVCNFVWFSVILCYHCSILYVLFHTAYIRLIYMFNKANYLLTCVQAQLHKTAI